MPGQVKTKQSRDVPRRKPGAGPPDINDNDTTNRNTQHSHALRLALGSILTPKRPYSPSSVPHSKSSSGTTSPALSYSFSSPPSSTIPTPPSVSPTPPHPPHPTPRGIHRLPDQYLHNLQYPHVPAQLPNMHQFSHLHTPSPLGLAEQSPSGDYLSKGDPTMTPPSTVSKMHDQQQALSSAAQREPRAPDPGDQSICAPAPAGPDASAQPRPRFIETLQSERAWDALIHGSFS